MGGELALNIISRRLSVCNICAPAHIFRPSANAKGSAESRSALGSLYSRQHHSQTLCVCSVMFSWTFGVAPLVAAPRLLKGRSVGKALPHFHSEPYVTLHPRRGFAYISHKTKLYLLHGTIQINHLLKATESAGSQIFVVCSPVRSVELLKSITCYKPRRAREAKYSRSAFLPASWNYSSQSLVKSHGERGKQQMRRDFSMMTPEICTAHICAIKNANMRRTSPKPASWRRGKFRASGRKRSRRCVTLVRTPVASVSGAQQRRIPQMRDN